MKKISMLLLVAVMVEMCIRDRGRRVSNRNRRSEGKRQRGRKSAR